MKSSIALGLCLFTGLVLLGWQVGDAAVRVKSMERTVVVKGLSEKEVPANLVIWPITFLEANNDLNQLFESIQSKNNLVIEFLLEHGLDQNEITLSPPSVTDLYAQNYGNSNTKYRYTGTSTITVYSPDVDIVRKSMSSTIELGKRGIAISGQNYHNQTKYVFNNLNQLKPSMVEEATKNARLVAEKFAADSESSLGKIKSARQGQFSIQDRDSTTPHIKKIRVVSTVEYYLSD